MMRCSKSGVEKIPKDWCAVQLQDIATVVPGGRLNLTKNEHYQKEGFVAFSAAGPDGFVALQEFSGEAVVLSSIGARCGKAFFADGAWTTLANTYVIQADEQRYSNRFLWYLINDEDYWHRSGTAQPFISPHDIRHAWVPSPSLQEQHKILDVLDGVSQTVANYQKQAEWLRRAKRGFLETLRAGAFFSKKPDRERLKGLTKVTMGETLISHQLTGTGIPVFSADTKEKPWGYTDNSKRRYPKGTIVVSARGSIGFPRLPKFETYTSTQTTLIVYPCERVSPEFMHLWLQTVDYKVLTAVQAVPMLTVATMAPLLIPVPTKAEQEAIVRRFRVVEQSLAVTKKLIAAHRELLRGMKTELLYGKKRLRFQLPLF